MASNLEIRSSYYHPEGLHQLTQSSQLKTNLMDTPVSSFLNDPADDLKLESSFNVATHMSKTIMNNLGEELKSISEKYCVRKLASHIKGPSKNEDRFSLSDIADKLEGFDFNSNNLFAEGVRSKFFIKPGAHKGNAILHIPAFVPALDLCVPKNATNFKIVARMVTISDVNRSGESFERMLPKLDGEFGSFQTSMLPVLKIATSPITTQLRVADVPSITSNASTVLVFAVKFYEYSDRTFTLLNEDSMMSIMRVF